MTTSLQLGTLLITPNAQTNLDPADVLEAIHRHSIGDWGELDDEDNAENDLSLKEGFRILSAYTDRNNSRFWIITAADVSRIQSCALRATLASGLQPTYTCWSFQHVWR